MTKKMLITSILMFSLNQNTHAETESAADLKNETNQEVSWSGYVTQSFENQGKLCYEVIKTKNYNNQKPIPGQFIEDSKYISCVESDKDITKSNNRYVTFSGKIAGSLEIDDYEFPIVMADKVRKWHYTSFSDEGLNERVGTIKPRVDRSRVDFIVNNSVR